jgi:hypothetical protein
MEILPASRESDMPTNNQDRHRPHLTPSDSTWVRRPSLSLSIRVGKICPISAQMPRVLPSSNLWVQIQLIVRVLCLCSMFGLGDYF